MRKSHSTGRTLLCLALVLLALSALAVAAYAAWPNTTLHCAFYGGTSDRYKIELFEVGAPYPSRQNIGTGTNFCPAWYQIVTYQRNYFIRVTNSRGQVKQSRAFWWSRYPRTCNWVRVYWNQPNLGLQQGW